MKPEAELQKQCVKWLKEQYPQAFFTHVPNEAKREWKTINALKSMGWVPGCPDLLIFNRNNKFSGLAIELKIMPNKITTTQQAFLNVLGENNWFCKVVWALDDFKYYVTEYFKDGVK